MARPISTLYIDPADFTDLNRLVGARTTPQRMVQRARIILLRGSGLSQAHTAAEIGVNRPVVSKWEARYRQWRVAGLREAKRSGRKPTISAEVRSKIITQATQPPAGRTRWSTRSMAKAMGVSQPTVNKLWRANDIKPHIKQTFKISKDPEFEKKFWDIIGLYLNPPDKALVLCCDEKSQCQALERTQPGLPLGIGHISTATHDYTRHGTVTLFAALNYVEGKLLHQTAARHTHVQWLNFLKMIDKQTPQDLTLHIILDNYATHKHAKVTKWVQWVNARHRGRNGTAADADRLVFHFTPTSSSWLNLVERFFRDLTVDCIRDGSFCGIKELVTAIETYLAEHNRNQKRYVWKAQGSEILRKIGRAKIALEKAAKNQQESNNE